MEVMYRKSTSEEFKALNIDIDAIISARTTSSIDEHYPTLLSAPKDSDIRITRDVNKKDGVSNSITGYLIQSRKLSDIQIAKLIEETRPLLESLCGKESFDGDENFNRYSNKGVFALAIQAKFDFTISKLIQLDLPICGSEAKACAKLFCESIKYRTVGTVFAKNVFEYLFSKGANLDFKISNKHPVEYIGESGGEELNNYLRSASLASKAESITKVLNDRMDTESKAKAVESASKISRGMSL